jgi:VWFA-related protein
MALGIVFDASASMRRAAPQAPLATAEILGRAAKGDEFFLIEFKALARMLVPLTRDVNEISGAMGRSAPEGRTALYDAVLLGLREVLKSESPRRALLVVTDGMDNQSLLSSAQIDRVIRESPVPIYTLAVAAGGLRAADLMAIEWLRRASELTGGRKYESRAGDLNEYARQIALDLRSRYVLGFQAARGDGKYHRLRVEVTPPADTAKARATARPGYLASAL